MTKDVQEVFGVRASYYVESKAHKDQGVLEWVSNLAELEPHMDVLDLATGTAHTAMHLAPEARRVVGADITKNMLLQARQEIEKKGIANIDLLRCDAQRLPFPDGSFHRVTCRRAMHHFLDVEGALREVHRILRPGGLLIIDDRSVPEDYEVDRMMNQLDKWHDQSHVRQHRASEWMRMLRESGFSVEEKVPYQQMRPLSSLTDHVVEEDRMSILNAIGMMDEGMKEKMSVQERDGTIYSMHWYILLKARRN
ncbi:MAG TPA: methyltransferase domain-containing protein [Methanomassiliicoccales archaeon]|nr:methyltransferase domain-containing protein [Methanomassiliicoccales archaeon]